MGEAHQAHGLKGQTEFYLPSGIQTHLSKGHSLVLKPLKGSAIPLEGQEFVIESITKINKLLVKLEGVPDRTALEKILPFAIYCERDQFPELPQGQFYVLDILGLEARTDQGVKLGKIESYYETPAGIVFTLRFSNGTEIDIPYVPSFFKKVVPQDHVVVVVPEVME